MKFTSKSKIGFGRQHDRYNARYLIFRRLMKLRHKYSPIEIYNYLGCSKEYFNGLLEWRWDCKKEYLSKLEELENGTLSGKGN